mgnify:CR=1 FL=1
MKRIRVTLAAALLAGVASVTAVGFGQPASAAPVICEKYGSTSIQSGRYIVQNNVWGADTAQCIDVNQSGGFTVTQADHNKPTNGAPAAYPSIFAGCHYTNCSTNSNMPIQVSRIGSASSSISVSYPGGGTWNAAYDIWLDPSPRTDGQNGAELMIWLNRQGSIQPIGSPIGNVSIAGRNWEVWYGNTGWHVISYVSPSPVTSINFDVMAFVNDLIGRGYGVTNSWYLTSIQAGFEPWIGGAGLAVTSFSASVTTGGGSGSDTTPPSVPQNLTVTGTTSTSVSLSWSPSTDNVGVTGYQIFRRQGTSGSFSEVGTTSGTSFTSGGLSPNTQYQFYVRARDAAGNVSGNSATVSATTQGGGGPGPGGCTATASVQSEWDQGYVLQVVVRNTGSSQISGWTASASLPSGHQVVNGWNANFATSGQTLTASSLSWNGNLAPGQEASFGFQASRSGGNPPTSFSCSAS